MKTVNWKKLFLYATVASFSPVLGQWANCLGPESACPAFNFHNAVLPAIPSLVATLAALFTNPWRLK